MDVDIIVVGDLGPLWNTDLGRFSVAAVLDPDARMSLRPELGIPIGSLCFNAGVLLINRSEWLRQQVTEKALDYLEKNHKVAKYADQDALNAVLVDNWLQIDKKYNIMKDYIPRDLRSKDIENFLADKVVIHFAQFYKPWHTLCNNRLRSLYYKYLAKTRLSNESKPMDFKLNLATVSGLLKVKVRELYYDYPIIPLGLLDLMRKNKYT